MAATLLSTTESLSVTTFGAALVLLRAYFFLASAFLADLFTLVLPFVDSSFVISFASGAGQRL